MEYIEVELKGYKRLQLNNIQTIKIVPKHILQLILGTNGSGKSSLLREITPLPSAPTHYEKDGYKILKINHNGNHYQVINRFDGKTGKYQLIRNGIEIFQGSTATDFRTLIKQEFGITPEIQSLIDGVVRFSTMDVSKRRYWFTMLSHADYTYAIEFYQRLRSRIRDLQGSLTIAQNRYTNELSKLLSEEEILEIREKVKRYQEIVDKLLEMKPRSSRLKSDLEKSLNDQDWKLREVIKQVDNLRISFSQQINRHFPMTFINSEICKQELYRTQGIIDHVKHIEANTRRRLETLHTETEALGKTHQFSLEELYAKKNEIEQSHKRYTNSLSVQITVGSISDFITAFESVYDSITRIFIVLEEFKEEDLKANRENFMMLSGRRDVVSKLLKDNQAKIQETQLKIRDMEYAKDHHQRECPSCHHRWFHGYEENSYKALKLSLESCLKNETIYENEFNILTSRVDAIAKIAMYREQLNSLSKSWGILKPIWEHLNVFDDPKVNIRVLNTIKVELPILSKIEACEKEIAKICDMIVVAERQSNINIEQHQELLQKTEDELVSIQERLRNEIKKTRILESFIKTFDLLKNYQEQLQAILQERSVHLDHLEDSLQNDHFNRLIMIFKQELAELEQSISKIDIQKAHIEKDKALIAEHEKQINALKICEQALSPSKGLIAKGLIGFINLFISRMNQFVKQIWIYPLEIMPISMKDEVDLDYKFPVLVDERFPAPDVKAGECNASTAEVFDLAFRIVAMECLGLKSHPLQVDEFGSSFDHQHRNAAFQVVTNLTTSTDIPQIWMVSHFEQNYGSLRNADITLLHKDNVVLPPEAIINGQTLIT